MNWHAPLRDRSFSLGRAQGATMQEAVICNWKGAMMQEAVLFFTCIRSPLVQLGKV